MQAWTSSCPGLTAQKISMRRSRRGQITAEKIDEIVGASSPKSSVSGLFEKPYADEDQLNLQAESATRLAKEVALQSIVLLENRGVLPLDPTTEPKGGGDRSNR